jgi:hypothetical protein
MQVQGNQITSVCLEQKQMCMRTEQQTQLTREVLHALRKILRQARRGRLCTAGACQGFSASGKCSGGAVGTKTDNSALSTQPHRHLRHQQNWFALRFLLPS